MKLLIVAGGGGHFSAALPVIEKLPKDVEVLIVGRKNALEGDSAVSFEYQTAKDRGIPFVSLTTGRLQRRFTFYTLFSLFKLPHGFVEALIIIKKFKPQLVVSFGGYVALPVTLAATLCNIPVIIHEQTLRAGLANRIAAPFAEKICISWIESKKYFPKEKTILTGNPIKQFKETPQYWMEKIKNARFEKMPFIFITGGSSGSHVINVAVEGCITKLLKDSYVVHQTGDAKQFEDFTRLSYTKNTLSNLAQKRYTIRKFLKPADMEYLLKEADMVISRAGINTTSELLYFGTPALLIPLPFAQNHEQKRNAEFLKKQGLGEILLQQDLTSEKLYSLIVSMMKNKNIYKASGSKTKLLIHENAAENIVRLILKYEKNKTQR